MQETQDRWRRACFDHPMLVAGGTLVETERTLADHILGLTGDARAALKRGLHRALDLQITHRERLRFTASKTPYKPPTVSCPVDGTPLRIRLGRSQAIVVDVVGEGGQLCGDEVVIDAVLPDTLVQGAGGRRLDEVMAMPSDLVDGGRTVVSAHVRFASTTVMRLSPAPMRALGYRDLFGRPEKRFADRLPSFRSRR